MKRLFLTNDVFLKKAIIVCVALAMALALGYIGLSNHRNLSNEDMLLSGGRCSCVAESGCCNCSSCGSMPCEGDLKVCPGDNDDCDGPTEDCEDVDCKLYCKLYPYASRNWCVSACPGD